MKHSSFNAKFNPYHAMRNFAEFQNDMKTLLENEQLLVIIKEMPLFQHILAAVNCRGIKSHILQVKGKLN